MEVIDFAKVKFTYNLDTKTITISEKGIRFATEYMLVNPKRGSTVVKFTHSTGPEFDPNTKYIYKDDNGLTLEVANDATITALRADAYVKAKTRR